MKKDYFDKFIDKMSDFFDKQYHKGRITYYQYSNAFSSCDYIKRTRDLYEQLGGK